MGRAWDLNPRLMLSPAILHQGPTAFVALRDPSDSQVLGLEKLQSSKSLSLSRWVTVKAQETGFVFIPRSFSERLDRKGGEVMASVS